MKIKALGVTLVTTALWSGALVAQSSTVTGSAAGINAPKSTLSVTPGVGTGARTYLSGNIAGGGSANTAGAFLSPRLTVDYKNPTIDFMLEYEMEMFSGRGFGSSPRSLVKNSYFQNHPVVIAAFKFAPDWSINSTNDISHKMGVDNADNSLVEITSINEALYKINNTFTVGAGWRWDYASSFSSTTGPATTGLLAQDKEAAAKAALTSSSENPSTVMNSATARVKIKFNNEYSLNTLVQAGLRRDENQKTLGDAATKYRYRINNDLNVAAIKNLDLALRYRLQLEDVKGASKGTWLHLGRVIANYAVAQNWTLDLTNTFVAVTPRDSGKKSVYENENYLGVSYKF